MLTIRGILLVALALARRQTWRLCAARLERRLQELRRQIW